MELGLDNRKKMIWAAVLGGLAVLAVAYEVLPLFWGSSNPVAASQPVASTTSTSRPAAAKRGTGAAKKVRSTENLDPTLQLQLLASSEQTQYSGMGRNIFVSQAPEAIPQPKGPGVTDAGKKEPPPWVPPTQAPAPPIPLKFFGFASKPGEAKKIFLSLGEDVFVASEGEIVNRRYKVIRISPTSVEMQDVLNSGPSQMIPLTQG